MSNLFVLALLMVLHASQFASSLDKDREHCAPTCSVCYKHNPRLNCPNVTCPNPGNCTSFTRDSCGCCLICAKLEGESCGGLHGKAGFCANQLRCNVSEKRALAGKTRTVGVCKDKFCFRSCENSKPSRVCGSDGKWYDNECELTKQNNCDNGTKVEPVDDINCEKTCPTSCKDVPYKPVCGSDKKIYRNVCRLKKNACFYGKNITVVPHQLCFNNPTLIDPCTHIKCGQGEVCVKNTQPKKTDKLVQCQCIVATENCLEAVHVCASDNTTYKSHCHMDAAACASRKKLTVLHYGDCKIVGSGDDNIPGQTYTLPPTTSKPNDPFHDQLNPRS